MVKMTFSPEAGEFLQKKLGKKPVLLLALNDGSKKYSLQG